MNIYKHHAPKFLDKGYSVIPDKGGQKLPAITEWSKYCRQQPTQEEFEGWSENLFNTNISVCLGEASGIIALDLDCTDDVVIDAIQHMFPPSPVEKKGTKGWTRFYKYIPGQRTELIKHNGEVVIELLSTGKKTTVPPSQLKGLNYEWTGDKELWELSPSDLPTIPVNLLAQIRAKLTEKFPDSYIVGNNIVNGRNDEMKNLVVKLQGSGNTVDEVLKKMLELDKTFETSLFSDPEENHHTEKYTNAGRFYFSVLNSINRENLFKKKVYEIPLLSSSVSEPDKEALLMGKSQSKGTVEMPRVDLPTPTGVLAVIQNWILDNSFKPQPTFALSAALACMATLTGRKFVFMGTAPNIYVINIGDSGIGKDMPQQMAQQIFIDTQLDVLLGSDDYTSDASLTDHLPGRPVRLDIIDEAKGLLASINKGKSEYGSKMNDILAKLWSSSNRKYLGRTKAGGEKIGAVYRPNVNLLCSTTPEGFSEGTTKEAFDTGLMGRFLYFLGDPDVEEAPLNFDESTSGTTPPLPEKCLNHLKWLGNFKPAGANQIGGITQEICAILPDDQAKKKLVEVRNIIINVKKNFDKEHIFLPVVNRLFEQLQKISMISALSRANQTIPVVTSEDVEFAFKVMCYTYHVGKSLAEKYVFQGFRDKEFKKVLNIIQKAGKEGISKRDIYRKTTNMNKMIRDGIYQDLLEHGYVHIYNNKLRDIHHEEINSRG